MCIRKVNTLDLDCHISLNDKLNRLGSILIHLRTAVLSRGKKLINFGHQTMFRLVVCSNLLDELTLFITVPGFISQSYVKQWKYIRRSGWTSPSHHIHLFSYLPHISTFFFNPCTYHPEELTQLLCSENLWPVKWHKYFYTSLGVISKP